jgi:predicted O-methyltransferase YrrM
MALEYRSDDWDRYKMDYGNPHLELEPPEREIEIVDGVLEMLVGVGALPHKEYDNERFLAHRRAVAEQFEIPWTAITPRMQRLLYAINAIKRPTNMLAAGVFCGNTFISNAGAGAGPGACYSAKQLIGIEIVEREAERAECNVRRVDPTGVARVVAADAIGFVREFPGRIDVLYLDADGDEKQGKAVYLSILKAGLDRMPEGSLVLAHNSVNCAERLTPFLEFVRDGANCRESVNVIFDGEGLEVSLR